MRKIKYLVMDVDGTLTDGKVYIGETGEIFKSFSIKDGCGIHDIAIPYGIEPIIMTGRESTIVEKRCHELGISNIYQGIRDKAEKIKEIFQEQYESVAYIGDDINDLPAMKIIKENGGIIGCPADATKEVLNITDYCCELKGGDGAVREFIEWLLH